MSNIFLTGKCNLKCSYCFASEFVNKKDAEFSIENFIKVLEFIKKTSKHVGLIGGEPTLHAKFDEILDVLLKDEDIKASTIYTNGLEVDKYIEKISNKKFKLLVNCNSPKIIGEKNYEALKNNLKLLAKEKKSDIHLGININQQEENYSYIFDLLNIVKEPVLRVSPAISNDFKTGNILDEYKKIKPTIMKVYKNCIKNNIIPSADCNALPYCILDKNDKQIMLDIVNLSKKLKINYDIVAACQTCKPVIDIFPDLTVARCFGLANKDKISLKEFKNISQIETYFINKIDIYAKLAFVSKECQECKYNLLDKCGICLSYKTQKAEKIKDFCKN